MYPRVRFQLVDIHAVAAGDGLCLVRRIASTPDRAPWILGDTEVEHESETGYPAHLQDSEFSDGRTGVRAEPNNLKWCWISGSNVCAAGGLTAVATVPFLLWVSEPESEKRSFMRWSGGKGLRTRPRATSRRGGDGIRKKATGGGEERERQADGDEHISIEG